MAGSKKKKPQLLYFFVEGTPYKKIRINKYADKIWAMNLKTHKIEMFSWTYLKKYHQKAWRTPQVTKMINRDRSRLYRYIHTDKSLPEPFRVHSMNYPDRFLFWLWTEKEILDLHDFILTQWPGAQRKDGDGTPKKCPTRIELLAMLREETVMYMRSEDGEFIPIFKEAMW